MYKLTAVLVCCGCMLFPGAVLAYVGPGAGLSLLGALWALLVAVGAAILFLIAWPIRRMRRRKREAGERAADDPQGEKLRQKERQAKERKPTGAGSGAVATESSVVPPANDRPVKDKRKEQQ